METLYILAQSSSYESGKQIGQILGRLLFPFILMLVLGSVNYRVSRFRGIAITFKQAVLAKWVVITSVILWVLGLIGQFAK